MVREIRTENTFLFSFLKDLLFSPFILILFLFRRRNLHDVLRPFSNLFHFLFEPKMTIGLIIATCVIFFWSMSFSEQTFEKLMLYPESVFTLDFLPLITSGFLHASFSHLLGNVIALFIFGRVVERKLGSVKLFLLYIGSLIISGLFTAIIHFHFMGDNTPGIGASGAIMGLVSAAILLDPFYLTYELLFPLPLMFVGWLVLLADIIGILNPVEDGIGHFAHLGGFLSIALLVFLLDVHHRKQMKVGLLVNIVTAAVFVCLRFFL